MLDLNNLADKQQFSRGEVMALLALQPLTRLTGTLIAYDSACPTRVLLQENAKSSSLVFPGGGRQGEESYGMTAFRESAIEEHPNLQHHVRTEEIQLFTVCSVVRTGMATDESSSKPLATFFDGLGLPPTLETFFAGAKVNMQVGLDLVVFAPVHGEVDLAAGTSDEAQRLVWQDLNSGQKLGYHHDELGAEWVKFAQSGFSTRPSPMKVYRIS